MKINHLGQAGRRSASGVPHAFFLTLGMDVEEIRRSHKKIVLVGGVCDAYFKAEVLLNACGISVYAYGDSSVKMRGQTLGNKAVLSTYALFKESSGYYFVIVGSMHRVNDVRLQLRHYHVTDYGIYFETDYHDFRQEDEALAAQIMESINELCFGEEVVERALPYFPNGGSDSVYDQIMEPQSGLLASTTWSHHAYLWEREYIRCSGGQQHVLEIGPGVGLNSSTLLSEFPDLKIDWMLFGESPSEEGPEVKRLRMVEKRFPNRVSENWGYIELPQYRLPSMKYDMVIMTEVFEHFGFNPAATLKKIGESLRDGGYMILTTPNWGHVHIYEDWRELPDAEAVNSADYFQYLFGHTYQYFQSELDEIFEQSGFSVVKYALSESNNHNYLLQKRTVD